MAILSFVSSFISPAPTARPAIEFAIAHAFHGVELSGTCYWPDILDNAETDWMLKRATEHRITYTIHFLLQAEIATHHARRRAQYFEQLEATIETARSLRVPVIVVHPGRIDCPTVDPERAAEPLRKDAIVNLVSFLREIAPLAEETGVCLCLENLHHRPGHVLQQYGELAAVIEAVDSPAVGITLDVGHADLADGLGPAIEAFRPYLRHVHLDDTDGEIDHIEVGAGRLDPAAYAGVLKPAPAIATLEVADDDDPLGVILRSRDVLRARLGNLIE